MNGERPILLIRFFESLAFHGSEVINMTLGAAMLIGLEMIRTIGTTPAELADWQMEWDGHIQEGKVISAAGEVFADSIRAREEWLLLAARMGHVDVLVSTRMEEALNCDSAMSMPKALNRIARQGDMVAARIPITFPESEPPNPIVDAARGLARKMEVAFREQARRPGETPIAEALIQFSLNLLLKPILIRPAGTAEILPCIVLDLNEEDEMRSNLILRKFGDLGFGRAMPRGEGLDLSDPDSRLALMVWRSQARLIFKADEDEVAKTVFFERLATVSEEWFDAVPGFCRMPFFVGNRIADLEEQDFELDWRNGTILGKLVDCARIDSF